MGEMRPGDWVCPTCGDHQFARNTECRKCSGGEVQQVCSVHGKPRSVNNLTDDGSGGMRCQPGFECQLSSGGKGGGKGLGGGGWGPAAGAGSGEMKPGDWNCPGCGDHQF